MPFKFLTRRFPLREYFFCVPRMCLGLMGFWPMAQSVQQQRRQLSWAWVNCIILAIGVVTELHAGILALSTDLALALDTLCPAGTSAVTLLKMLLILYYRQDLVHILEHMQRLVYAQHVQMKPLQERIVRNHAVMASRLNFITFEVAFFTATSYSLRPLLLSLILWLQGQEWACKLPYNMTMPMWLLRAPYFPLTYIFTTYTGYITIFLFGGCDAFYFEFCANTAALLQLLQEDLKAILNFGVAQQRLTSEQSEILEYQLVRFIKRHNEIIALTRYFCQRYSIITLAHFVSAGLVIGVSIFDLMTFSGFGLFIYVGYTIAALGQLFIYCYGGNMVTQNSVQLATIAFGGDWHLCTPKLRRYIQMIIMRSQRPLTLAVPFFVPSLAVFMAILQTSGSIIALASSFK